ncbi:MAG TPA: hypothetical protein DCR14_10870 [Acidimicrobiaceae bacterium]|nr:hypothetical protein [Acidimicrobiaceae bacterium]
MARRDVAVSGVLWGLGASIVVASSRAASAVAVQADDLLNLFVIDHDGSSPGRAAWARFWAQLEAWGTGETDHFSPLGSGLDIWIKRWMVEQPFGLSMHQTHHLAFLVAALLSFVAATQLVRHALGVSASSCAVPVAIGWAACAQVTTVWSTYDPLVVHPTYGVLVTAVGLWFLVAVQHVVARPEHRRWRFAAAGLGVTGVALYVGFTVFVVAALALVLWPTRALPRSERLRSQRIPLMWALLPAAGLVLVTRVWSAMMSESVYEGTSVQFGLSSITGTSSGTYSTLPMANWGRARVAAEASGVEFGLPSPWWLTGLLAAAAAWWWAYGRSASTSPTTTMGVDDSRPSGARSLAVCLVVVGIGSVSLFALTGLWGPYLSVPGNTYMGASSTYWVCSAVLGICLLRAAQRSGMWAGVALVAVASLAVVQWSVNDAVVEVERRSPSPFGVDLVEFIDSGVPADEPARCDALGGVPQAADLDRWYDRLNAVYAERHGEPFCSSVPTPSGP